jgi:hypothetical protein
MVAGHVMVAAERAEIVVVGGPTMRERLSVVEITVVGGHPTPDEDA